MATKWMNIMEKVGLVEIEGDGQSSMSTESSDDDMARVDALLAKEGITDASGRPLPQDELSGAAVQSAEAPNLSPPLVAAGNAGRVSEEGVVEEGREFIDLYADARVGQSPYTAEKLIRVLDGLKAMEPATRKAAVLAMDGADEEWSVADAILDAQRKVQVLKDRSESIRVQVSGIRDTAMLEKQKRDDYLAQATEAIQRSIAEAQEKLRGEQEMVSQAKAAFDAQVTNAEAAYHRESSRLTNEAQRLGQIEMVFGGSVGPESPISE